jgi:aryl-alcohol dehydrogenase-like predicted oxidoreductase
MHYTLLGQSGLRVSELALGTMTFGTDWGWGASLSESAKQFELFAEAGGTLIDTANRYTDGSAETILGDLLAADRDHFVVGTKYSLNTRDGDLNAGQRRLHLRRHVGPPGPAPRPLPPRLSVRPPAGRPVPPAARTR